MHPTLPTSLTQRSLARIAFDFQRCHAFAGLASGCVPTRQNPKKWNPRLQAHGFKTQVVIDGLAAQLHCLRTTRCELVESPEQLSLEEQRITITQLVRAYFAQHPRAMDTAAGIMEWWLPAEKIRTHPETVKQVLNEMTEQGFLERIGSGDYAHYRMRSDGSS